MNEALFHLLLVASGFLLGVCGALYCGWLIHQRTLEDLRNEHKSRLLDVKRQAYAAGYEDRAFA